MLQWQYYEFLDLGKLHLNNRQPYHRAGSHLIHSFVWHQSWTTAWDVRVSINANCMPYHPAGPGFRSHDRKCQNQPPTQQIHFLETRCERGLFLACRASFSALARKIWLLELKSLEWQCWQHLDEELLPNLWFKVQAWLGNAEPKSHFRLLSLGDFPNGLAQLTNKMGFFPPALLTTCCVGQLCSFCPTLDPPHSMFSNQLVAVLKTHWTDWILTLLFHRGWPCSTNGNLSIFVSGMTAGRAYERHICLLRFWIFRIVP